MIRAAAGALIAECVFGYMEELKQEIIRLVSKRVAIKETQLKRPPREELGDLALPCFELAKAQQKKPEELAHQLAAELEQDVRQSKFIAEARAVGPYINFFANKAKLAELVLSDVLKLKQDYGRSLAGRGKTVLVEFCSPNTNKPLHLGHLRNMMIGASLAAVLAFCGYKVVKANLINDRGIHICQTMLAYQKWGKAKEPDKKPDHFVGDFYVLYHKKAAENPELEAEAAELLRRWEAGDKEVLALWKKLNNWVYRGFDETYEKLGIRFDVVDYESQLYEEGKRVVLEGLEKGIFKRHTDGCVVAELEPDLPNKVLIRADGTAVYMTQDIALAIRRFKTPLDSLIYVVGSEQNLHFQQLFAILRKLGFDWVDRCHHLSYGMVWLPEGVMKSREGIVIEADDLMAEMERLARSELAERYATLAEKELAARAAAIALAAMRFHFVKQDPDKDMLYDPRESISFEGETGPYIQYAYARIASIIEKYGGKIDREVDFSLLSSEQEQRLIRLISQFPLTVEDAAKTARPYLIARALIELAQAFNEFYHLCPVLQVDDATKRARLVLISGVKQVLRNGLGLLGIQVLEEM